MGRHLFLLVLSEHIKGEKLYACEQCGKVFPYVKSLQSHKNTYTGVKPYECQECVDVLAWRSTFQIDVVTHIGDLPYNVGNVRKHSFIPILLQCIKAVIMEGNPISVNSVEKPLQVLKESEYMK